MGRKKAAVAEPMDSKDSTTIFWFCMAALVPMLAMGMQMFTAMPYRPPLAKTDIYSGYRWARCDTNPKHCDREYNETTVRRVVPYTQRLSQCAQETKQEGVPIIVYSTDPDQHHVDKKTVGSMSVYGRVARELDDLRSEGIDPIRLEKLLVSLAQTSSGNVGESIALKRPELEQRYWDQLKAFVHKYPEPDTGDVQELFKDWYKQDPDVHPPQATMPSLPAYGDFKWRMRRHSGLNAERYMSSVFYAGGYPWRMIYYPRALSSPAHMSIYLTPAASQLSLPNWSRRVSFSIRVFGHDKPAMSIWANYSSCTFTADKRDTDFGFEHFTTHTLLETPGRGYLKNDVLEIRAIVRVDAVSNMAPPPPSAHMNTGKSQTDIRTVLQGILRLPMAVMSTVLGEGVSKGPPCKWCSWQGGPSLGNPLPFGLKLYRDAADDSIRLGHVFGDRTWLRVALYGLMDVLVPCGCAIALCHAAALPLLIFDHSVGSCSKRLDWAYSVLCQLREVQSMLPSVLGLEGCVARMVVTSVLSQQLLSRAGLLGLLCAQLLTLALRCPASHDAEEPRPPSEPASSPCSSAASSSVSSEPLPAAAAPALWLHMSCMTVLAEALTGFGALWRFAAPLGMGLLMVKGERPSSEVVYFQVLPAALADCLCHSAVHPAQLMLGPAVLILKELGVVGRAASARWAGLLPTEESMHASVCSAAAFVCLACLLVPELRLDWKLAAPLLALMGSGPVAAVALAGAAVWEGLQELPPGQSPWQWLWSCPASLPAAVLRCAVHAVRWPVQQSGAAVMHCWRMLAVAYKSPPQPAPKKPNGAADVKAIKRCASISPKQGAKPKQAAQGRAAGSRVAKPKRRDCKPAAAPPAPAKGKPEQALISAQPYRAFDATATVTVTAGSQKPTPLPHSRQSPSPTRPPLLPVTLESNHPAELMGEDPPPATQRPEAPPPTGIAKVAGLFVRTQLEGTLIQNSPPPATLLVPVTPPASDALPLPVSLLRGSQPQPAPAVVLTPVLQEPTSRGAQPPVSPAAARVAVPIPASPAAAALPLCSPEDLLLAMLTGAPRGGRLGCQVSRHAPPAAVGAAGLPSARPPTRVRAAAAAQGSVHEDMRDEAEAARMCVMCWDNPRQTTLAPCGHRALCAACTCLLLGQQRTQPLCPICRCGVQSYITREFDA